jgi:hypothetical protein
LHVQCLSYFTYVLKGLTKAQAVSRLSLRRPSFDPRSVQVNYSEFSCFPVTSFHQGCIYTSDLFTVDDMKS